MAKKEKESVLETVAKTIGTVAGKAAVLAGVTPPTAKKEKIPKLEKKNKSRLPRREKKEAQKAAAKKSSS